MDSTGPHFTIEFSYIFGGPIVNSKQFRRKDKISFLGWVHHVAMSPKFFPARAVCLALLALWVVVLGEEAEVPEKMVPF